MKVTYICGCYYEFSGRINEEGTKVLPDYVDDDGNDYELCDKHEQELIENWP